MDSLGTYRPIKVDYKGVFFKDLWSTHRGFLNSIFRRPMDQSKGVLKKHFFSTAERSINVDFL